MNIGRIVVGGIVAGVIINIAAGVTNGALLGQQWKEWSQRVASVNQLPSNGAGMGFWAAVSFGLGFVGIWLYAAIRPRFGAGPKTAIIAALVLWFVFWPLVSLEHMALGTVPVGLLTMSAVGGLVGTVVALLAGGALYKESA